MSDDIRMMQFWTFLVLGSILVAAQEPHAIVLEQPVTVGGAAAQLNVEQAKKLAALIQKALIDRYAKDRGLEVTDAEFAALKQRMPTPPGGRDLEAELRQGIQQSGATQQQIEEQVKQFSARRAAHDREFFGGLIQYWKVGRDIHARYGGGRLRLSAFGFHDPMDAMEKFYIDQEGKGAFRIPNAANRAAVWRVFQDKTGGDGTVGEAKAIEIYRDPPWESKRPGPR